jgi:hypothetical protein
VYDAGVMAAWITIYLQDPPPELSPAAIQDGIDVADWWTHGEQLGLEEHEVDEFLDRLTWQAQPLELSAEGQRPIQFHVRTDPAQIVTELDELDELDGVVVPASVRERLRSIRAIVSLELGFAQLETMFAVVAFEIAFWLAGASRGVIRGPDELWYDHAAHRWQPIAD